MPNHDNSTHPNQQNGNRANYNQNRNYVNGIYVDCHNTENNSVDNYAQGPPGPPTGSAAFNSIREALSTTYEEKYVGVLRDFESGYEQILVYFRRYYPLMNKSTYHRLPLQEFRLNAHAQYLVVARSGYEELYRLFMGPANPAIIDTAAHRHRVQDRVQRQGLRQRAMEQAEEQERLRCGPISPRENRDVVMPSSRGADTRSELVCTNGGWIKSPIGGFSNDEGGECNERSRNQYVNGSSRRHGSYRVQPPDEIVRVSNEPLNLIVIQKRKRKTSPSR